MEAGRRGVAPPFLPLGQIPTALQLDPLFTAGPDLVTVVSFTCDFTFGSFLSCRLLENSGHSQIDHVQKVR